MADIKTVNNFSKKFVLSTEIFLDQST